MMNAISPDLCACCGRFEPPAPAQHRITARPLRLADRLHSPIGRIYPTSRPKSPLD
jgi:hypothetical protein